MLINTKKMIVTFATMAFTFSFMPVASAQSPTKTATLVPVINLLLEDSGREKIELEEAARFLIQASYGPTYDEIVSLSNSSYEAWIDQQLSLPATMHMDTGIRLGFFDRNRVVKTSTKRHAVWNSIAMDAPDQLRQRMAFALSQIFVINDQAYHTAATHYYDLLVDNAFVNYRDLLEKVTLSGSMGAFLGMAGNQRANENLNILRPDENFAREVLQLFSIGLVQLKLDGTAKLDKNGKTIPTYSQSEIEEFAKVFTGWHFNYVSRATFQLPGGPRFDPAPMLAFQMYHDQGSKRLLAFPGAKQNLPANQSAEKDLEDALDNIFNHPNVGPFISKQLIQRFVTSNPSPAYVRRIASVFNDNGKNVRGDLGAVIKAILLDVEARKGHITNPVTFGKMKEPILKATALWRAVGFLFHGEFAGPSHRNLIFLKQFPLQARSVFNFYRPDHSPSGKLAQNGLLSPESQLLDIASVISMGSAFTDFSFFAHHELEPGSIYLPIDTLSLLPFVPDNLLRPEELIDRLDLMLLAGTMPSEMRTELLNLYGQNTGYIPQSKRHVVNDILYLIMLSPYSSVQR